MRLITSQVILPVRKHTWQKLASKVSMDAWEIVWKKVRDVLEHSIEDNIIDNIKHEIKSDKR